MLLSLCCLHLAAARRSCRMHSRNCARVRFDDFADFYQLLEPAKIVRELSLRDGSKDLCARCRERSAFGLDLGNELHFRAVARYRPESNGAGVMNLGAVERSPFDDLVWYVVDHRGIPLDGHADGGFDLPVRLIVSGNFHGVQIFHETRIVLRVLPESVNFRDWLVDRSDGAEHLSAVHHFGCLVATLIVARVLVYARGFVSGIVDATGYLQRRDGEHGGSRSR